MPRPRAFADHDIAAAALAVIDRDGLANLSMRTLAAQLGLRTMSIYRYVTSREHLEQLVVASIVAQVDTEVEGTWQRRVEQLVERMHAAAARHPGAAPLLLAHRHVGESSWRWGETMLAALADAGLRGRDRAIALRALQSYLYGAIDVQRFGPLAGNGTAALAQLPGDEFPHLSATARASRGLSPAEEFRRGLALLIRGLATTGEPPRAPARRRRPRTD